MLPKPSREFALGPQTPQSWIQETFLPTSSPGPPGNMPGTWPLCSPACLPESSRLGRAEKTISNQSWGLPPPQNSRSSCESQILIRASDLSRWPLGKDSQCLQRELQQRPAGPSGACWRAEATALRSPGGVPLGRMLGGSHFLSREPVPLGCAERQKHSHSEGHSQ